ncbi:MerR family transcriptional regulator [Murimonas intestini]|uniref:DNA-binding transcriptional MerR regulator n=1 Tax=Murimonas intestini TaxID=1337051 RepID=A0AB73SYJ1_9FIRM|nr:MerR family transcriptional regulator [Murimonas intestini]MCR1840308.1 MerR family transcriptional regulator [Murimonas intestini]MCR1868228.1 MerR family transcriptional regulator [Murimonas intestini]MCR1885578.1 MerR family transcriptional regulator [Murimonas intestini]
MNTYKTTEIANIIGIHPNTVRLYEKLGLIPEARRKENGYRIFTDLHIEQFRLARAALKVEILQNGLRKKAMNIIKVSAAGNFDKALILTDEYLSQLEQEKNNAEEAIKIVEELLDGKSQSNGLLLKRREVSEYLGITMDTLRNWELNGLLRVKRKSNGYRVYTSDDIRRLRIIRALRCANYSLASILRMLNAVSVDPDIDIKDVIGRPEESEDIITACDKLLLSLHDAKENALFMKSTLENMKET